MANADCIECHCPGEMVDETEMLSGEESGTSGGMLASQSCDCEDK